MVEGSMSTFGSSSQRQQIESSTHGYNGWPSNHNPAITDFAAEKATQGRGVVVPAFHRGVYIPEDTMILTH